MFTFISNLFRAKKMTPVVVFGRHCLKYGIHGMAKVSSKKHGLKNTEVPFVFVAQTLAPELNLEALIHVEAEAARQGYEFHSLTKYQHVVSGYQPYDKALDNAYLMQGIVSPDKPRAINKTARVLTQS